MLSIMVGALNLLPTNAKDTNAIICPNLHIRSYLLSLAKRTSWSVIWNQVLHSTAKKPMYAKRAFTSVIVWYAVKVAKFATKNRSKHNSSVLASCRW